MKLHDIVTNTIEFEGVPIGTRGTIVHVYPKDLPHGTYYEVEFVVAGKSIVETVSDTMIKSN